MPENGHHLSGEVESSQNSLYNLQWDHRGFQREIMGFQMLIDRSQSSRPQITSVFLSSPRLCLYSTEIKKYQDSVRLSKNLQGKQKKLPIVTVYLEGPSYYDLL